MCKSQLFNTMLADYAAKLFEHVYSYLLDDKFPLKYYSELDYYLVPYDIDSSYYPVE